MTELIRSGPPDVLGTQEGADPGLKNLADNLRKYDWIGLALFLLGAASGQALAAAGIPLGTPAEAGLSETALAGVDQFMERSVSDRKMAGGVVLVSHRGRVCFFRSYGLMDLESGKSMTPDTIFRIHSLSKPITTAAALTLYDSGKIGLDDPVTNYLPVLADAKVADANGLRPPSRSMTIRDLMLHTSGLTYGERPDAIKEAYDRLKPLDSTNLVEMTEKLSRVPLAFDPGTDWMYGTGIDVLGRVIEVVSGEDLDVYLQKCIFEPLEMNDTGFRVPPEKIGRFAANYARSAEGLKLIDAPANSAYAKPVTFFSGGSGLVGTAGDYLRFLAMIEGGGVLEGHRILRPETVKLMTSNQLPPEAFPIYFGSEKRAGTGFGLGFSVRTEITSWDPAGHVGEYGWGGAASTHFWASPLDNLIVITMEQIMPYQWDTEFGIKQMIYDGVRK